MNMTSRRSPFARSALLVLGMLTSSCASKDDGGGRAAPAAGASKPTAAAAAAVAPSAPNAPPTAALGGDALDLPSLGSADARVTMLAFLDYDCPYCARADTTVAELRRRHEDDLRVLVANRPLPMHERARPAALAALAAADLGAFEAMHAELYLHSDHHTDEGLEALARNAGLDPAAFRAARTGERAARELARSEALADELHVRGTPTFFVNGRRIVGAQPIATFESAVADGIASADELLASGVPRARLAETFLARARALGEDPADVEERWTPELAAEARRVAAEAGAPFLGRAAARTTIVVFTDLDCPYCARLDGNLRELVADHPDVKVTLRHHPLPMHAQARLAAKAAIAAERQGKLAELVHVLFVNQPAHDRASLEKYAASVGLDRARFARDLDDPELDTRLAADEADAQKLHVKGTPTMFIDGKRVAGARPLAELVDAVGERR